MHPLVMCSSWYAELCFHKSGYFGYNLSNDATNTSSAFIEITLSKQSP